MAPMHEESRPAATRTHGTIVSALVIAVAAIYGQTVAFDFINFDDGLHVYANPQVNTGLSFANIAWAFTHSQAANWQPLTWISHMAVCAVAGLHAGAHHAVNAALHALAAVLLYGMLFHATGRAWRSALVAAIFAVHPAHVESVAWITERKDILSAIFLALTLWAYTAYARAPSIGRYALAAFCLALGLLAKPMLVTLPCVLLLWDIWPLQRYAGHAVLKRGAWLAAEKIPFFVLAAGAIAVTLWAQGEGGAIRPIDVFPASMRLQQAVVSYGVYARMLVWPVGLCLFYPHPMGGYSLPEVTLTLLVIVSISVAAIALLRTRPYVFVGWFWFLGMLVPVIGLVQVGVQAYADRYTYLPSVGFALAAVWLVAEARPVKRHAAAWFAGAAGLCLLYAGLAFAQTQYWRDSESVWRRAIAVTGPNALANRQLGIHLVNAGRLEEGIAQLNRSLDAFPDNEQALEVLAFALEKSGNSEGARRIYRRMLELDADSAAACINLARIALEAEHLAEAEPYVDRALTLAPDDPPAVTNLGVLRAMQGRYEEAARAFLRVAEHTPDDASTWFNLANAYLHLDQYDEADKALERGLALAPSDKGILELRDTIRRRLEPADPQ